MEGIRCDMETLLYYVWTSIRALRLGGRILDRNACAAAWCKIQIQALLERLSSNLQVVSSRSCFPPMTCIGFDKEMKMKCCCPSSDATGGRAMWRMWNFNYWRLETLTAHCSAYLSHASGAAPAITTIDASSAQGDTVTIKINLQCLLLIWASEPERIES